jgi:uncharacterized membrane protein
MDDSAASGRLWEIDALRTLAIVLMIVYHVAWDVDFLAPEVPIEPLEGGWKVLQIVCGSMFLAIVGVSFWVADSRAVARGLRGWALWRTHVRRAVEVLAAALLVSVVTYIAFGHDGWVRFGILHLIGLLMLVVLPLVIRLRAWNALLGGAIIALGILTNPHSSVPGALALGFRPPVWGVDWYPLVPWAGAALMGAALGSLLYPGGRRGPWLRRLPHSSPSAVRAGLPGRHSLPIYLVHQPVLIVLTAGVLAVLGMTIEL